MTALLSARGLGFAVGRTQLVRDVSFELEAGELLAVVGANGAGKSTLLRMLAGDLKPGSGSVEIAGRPIGSYRTKALARLRAVLPQRPNVEFAFPVHEIVRLGRSPHAHRDVEPARDTAIVDEAMRRAAVGHLRERSFPSLSGGEQARVCFARILAQETPLVLLDEPTAALDVRHQHAVLGETAKLVAGGTAAIAVLHDLNLAAAYATRVLLMSRGETLALGAPRTCCGRTS